MEYILRRIHTTSHPFGWLYVANLLIGFHYFLIQFVHSSFLLTFMTRAEMGMLVAFSSLCGLVALGSSTRLLARIGAYRTVVYATILDMIAMLGISTSHNTTVVVTCFVLNILLVPILLFCLDIFLENRLSTNEEKSGNIHGIYLSWGMAAALFSPAIAGRIAGDQALFTQVYLMSGAFLIPFLLLTIFQFRSFADPVYAVFRPIVTLREIFRDHNIFHVMAAQFLMRFYFAWMIIYLPIHLHTVVGFSWPDIGLILFFMLIPYLLVEWPAGVLADRWLGEKELLLCGFFITASATLAMMYISSHNLLLWSIVLGLTRVGTALIEAMSETYFFKKVHAAEADLMSFFRMLRPLAFIVGPITATLTLHYLSLTYLWGVLAALMLTGVIHAAALIDTR
jgi:nitrate/nitrite transporter NarK